ncbi:MAG: outer membrane lipoprotein chaperone LolA [Gemmatimonadetes bacterium]|nr:outer membrane lipoprotein chaperone LolA [Gemmatimonadota bacterium]
MRPVLALALFLPVSLVAQATAADSAVERAVAAYAGVRTARATFEQTITNTLTGSVIPSRGEFQQSRPDRFAFRFSDPKGDVILSDGKFVWLYLPSSTKGQVIRAPLTADIEGSIDLVGAFFTNPRQRYTITDAGAATIDGRATRAVNLVPRKGDASFTRARIWVDVVDGWLRQFEAQEPSGLTRKVKVTSFSPNAAVEASAFTFKPPRGVRVVESSSIR